MKIKCTSHAALFPAEHRQIIHLERTLPMFERGSIMIRTVIFGMIILGSLLMVYNIIGFVRFARRIKSLKNWGGQNKILNIPKLNINT